MTALRAFAAPGRYLQGPGAVGALGEILRPYGSSPLVIMDPAVRAMLRTKIEGVLHAAGQSPEFALLPGEITYAAVEAILQAQSGIGRGASAGVVVGIGGGKVLDAAKAVALRLGKPVVTVPSIASNDSPASAAVAMYDEAHTLIAVDRLTRHPEVVVVDTELIAQAPVAFLRAGIGDAISKRFEAEACRLGTGLTPVGTRPLLTAGAIADACYRTIRRHAAAALRACEQDRVTDDLEATVEAVILMSGLGFENGGLSLAHALTRGLVRARGASSAQHGSHVAWGLLVQLAVAAEPDAAVRDLLDFYREIGLPVSLPDLGMPAPTSVEIERIAQLTMAAPHIVNFPVVVDAQSIAAAIRRIENFS